jgi:hypothetical protein
VTVDVDPVYDMGESAVGESHGLIEDTKTVVVENVVAPVQETIAPVVAPVQEHFVAPIQDTVGKIGDVFGGGKKKKKKKGPFGF